MLKGIRRSTCLIVGAQVAGVDDIGIETLASYRAGGLAGGLIAGVIGGSTVGSDSRPATSVSITIGLVEVPLLLIKSLTSFQICAIS